MSTPEQGASGPHPFENAPHATFLRLAVPVLLALIAEPLTGVADTAFVARLGPVPLAALGVAVTLLSSLFWVFNFLGIGTQTVVAQSLGRGDRRAARDAAATALAIALAVGVGIALLAWGWVDSLVAFMGARDVMAESAASYLRIRLFAAPAVLITLAAFGALRGLQDMRTPFVIAVALNVVNIGLDALLIFGAGPIPAFGLVGAAWATVVSQWLGSMAAATAALFRLGGRPAVRPTQVRALLVIGRDLVVRTGLLLLFLLLATRAATRLGPDQAAAHQAVRQFWMLAAFLLDAFAASAQSLVGFFVGAGALASARKVARVACLWGGGAGVAIVVVGGLAQDQVVWLLLPPSARGAFFSIWALALLAQPMNAVAFVTDGIHWGTGDYRFLRNAMVVATATGSVLLLGAGGTTLVWIWVVIDFWIGIRALAGLVRIWPGFGRAPLAQN
jgi:MATE family multidrug resistance protein